MEISKVALNSINILKEVSLTEIIILDKEMIWNNNNFGININVSIENHFNKNIFLPYKVSESIIYNTINSHNIAFDFLMFYIRDEYKNYLTYLKNKKSRIEKIKLLRNG